MKTTETNHDAWQQQRFGFRSSTSKSYVPRPHQRAEHYEHRYHAHCRRRLHSNGSDPAYAGRSEQGALRALITARDRGFSDARGNERWVRTLIALIEQPRRCGLLAMSERLRIACRAGRRISSAGGQVRRERLARQAPDPLLRQSLRINQPHRRRFPHDATASQVQSFRADDRSSSGIRGARALIALAASKRAYAGRLI